MTTLTVAVPTPPSSSRTVTSTSCGPSAVNAWVVAHDPVPEPAVSVTVPLTTAVPSPKLTVQVWLSLRPASVNGAVNATVLPRTNNVPLAGAEMVTAGATLVNVNVVLAATGALTPSFPVSVNVKVPSSVQVTVVETAAAVPNGHGAPGSTPDAGAILQ